MSDRVNEINEALAIAAEDWLSTHEVTLAQAARDLAVLLDKFTCPKCRGKGVTGPIDCQLCGGSGNAIPTEWVEAVAASWLGVEPGHYTIEQIHLDQARAALLVVVEKIKEGL